MARITGHEAALFAPSGTMTNQLALRTWLQGGLQSVLLDSRSHIYRYENAGIAFHSHCGTTPVNVESAGSDPHLTLGDITRNLISTDIHHASTRVISLENTLNGSIFPLESIRKISDWIRAERNSSTPSLFPKSSNDMVLHLDGARLWNACAETATELSDICKHFDSVSLCLSKGIGAPIGSILVGNSEMISKARHYRKLFGGGWRQSGVLASAAIYAIEHVFLNNYNDSIDSPMKTSHHHARYIAQRLTDEVEGCTIANKVETNMVFPNFRNCLNGRGVRIEQLARTIDTIQASSSEKVKISPYGYSYYHPEDSSSDADYVMRLVTHYQIDQEGCDTLIDLIKSSIKLIKDMSD